MEATLQRLAATPRALPVRRTERLILRPWREADRDPFAAMNADPDVMEFYPAPLTRAESDALMDDLRLQAARRGFGVWAVQETATGELVGMMELWAPSWEAEFTPAVEIGWRFVRAAWGKGLALEAARSALAYAFEVLELPYILSWTVPANVRSWRLMERLGLVRQRTFEHPRLPVGHALREHVLYRLDAPRRDAAAAPPAGAEPASEVAPAAPPRPALPRVWIDGDGCPRVVKEIVWKAAHRGVIEVTMVANRQIVVPRSPRIHTVCVSQGMDVADDWLVAHAAANELVITADVPLAAELIARGVQVITPRGEWFTPANMGEKLSLRDYFTEARASGMLDGGGGAAPFDERAKRVFASGFDRWVGSRRGVS